MRKNGLNLINKVFGELTVIGETRNKRNERMWLCQCNCENKTQVMVDKYRLEKGLKTHCGCKRQYKRHKDKEFPQEYLGKIKTCTTCWSEHPYTNFYFKETIDIDGNKQYLFNSRCIDCHIKLAGEWIDDNPDKYKIYKKTYDAKEQRKVSLRAGAKKRRDSGEYYQWLKDNPDKVQAYRENHREHDITEAEWRSCLKIFSNTCAYCGISIEQHIIIRSGKLIIMNFHKEHVDEDGYNDLRNAVPACRDCNSSKYIFPMEDWYKKQEFFTQERYNKIMWWIIEGYKDYIEEKPPYRIVRKRREGLTTYYYQLWSVDEKRNMVEVIDFGDKKKDLNLNLIHKNTLP